MVMGMTEGGCTGGERIWRLSGLAQSVCRLCLQYHFAYAITTPEYSKTMYLQGITVCSRTTLTCSPRI
jgi:hypothetical protein